MWHKFCKLHMMKNTSISINSITIALIFFFFLQIFLGCSQTPQYKSSLSESINPNSCRIIGVVEAIEDFKDTSGPCSTQPCVATVKINSIISRGMGFTEVLSSNDIINLKFEFTLSPTSEEMFPKLKNKFPGLKIGDKFKGDIEKVLSIKVEGIETPDIYRIFNYDFIN